MVIVEPAAMIVKPSADGKWQMVRTSSITTQSREPRRGEVELDLFQVGTDKERNEEKEPSVQLELFRVEKKQDHPDERERGAVELNLFGNGPSREEDSKRDSKAYALISQSPSGNWVQKGSSENKVCKLCSCYYLTTPFQGLPFKLNLLGIESKVSNNNKHLEITAIENRKIRHQRKVRRRRKKQQRRKGTRTF